MNAEATLCYSVSVPPHLLEGIPQLFHPNHVCCFCQEFGPHEFNKVLKVNMSSHCGADQKEAAGLSCGVLSESKTIFIQSDEE